MAKVLCKINVGLKNQTVYIQNQENNKIESYEIPIQNIVDFLIKKPEITEIHLGGSKIYIQKIEDDIKELELKKYSKNKIQFIYDI